MVWAPVGAPQGTPTGTPWTRHVIDASSRGADGARARDVDGDGWPDLVVPWEEGGLVRAYTHPGPERVRATWPFVTVGEVASPEDAFFVDLNGDGAFDVVTSAEGDSSSVFVHWAPADPARRLSPRAWITQALPAVEDEAEWMFAVALQVDGEHGPDLVLGSKERGASIGWLRAPALVSELPNWRFARLRSAGWIMSLLAIDLDGDGDEDLLVSDRQGRAAGVSWFEHAGPPDAWPEHPIAAGDEEVLFIDAADLDGDGRVEVLAAVKPMRVVIARRADGAAIEAPWRALDLDVASNRVGTAKAVRAADLDLDGRLDVVVSCEDADAPRSGVFWLRALDERQERWETRELAGPAGRKFDLVETLDLDGDGDLDVVTTEEQDGLGVVWYENPTR